MMLWRMLVVLSRRQCRRERPRWLKIHKAMLQAKSRFRLHPLRMMHRRLPQSHLDRSRKRRQHRRRPQKVMPRMQQLPQPQHSHLRYLQRHNPRSSMLEARQELPLPFRIFLDFQEPREPRHHKHQGRTQHRKMPAMSRRKLLSCQWTFLRCPPRRPRLNRHHQRQLQNRGRTWSSVTQRHNL